MAHPSRGAKANTFKAKAARLSVGLLGAVIFAAVWMGVSALGQRADLAGWIYDVVFVFAGIATYAAYVRIAERRDVRELSLRGSLPETGGGFLGGILLFSIVIAVLAAGGHYRVLRIEDPSALLRAPVPWFAGAIMEELLFRGFIFGVLRDVAGLAIAIAISALLFGLVHAANPGATGFSCVAIALEAGVLLAVAYAATNRLWLPIGLHAGWNYAEGTIFGTAVSGGGVKTAFVHSALSGSPLLTGGAFGPEASIVAIPVCLAAALALALKVKQQRFAAATN